MKKVRSLKTNLIHIIESTWETTKKGKDIINVEQMKVIAAIDCTLFFLDLYDNIRNENHKVYFIKKHLSLHNNMTQIRLSSAYGICKDSVSTYCNMYLKIFEKCFNLIKKWTNDLNNQFLSMKFLLFEITNDLLTEK